MEFLVFTMLLVLIAAVIFAAIGNSKKQEQIDELNKSLENTLDAIGSAKEKPSQGHVGIDVSLISAPVHTIAQLISEGNTFKITCSEFSDGGLHYDWVFIRHLGNNNQSSAIHFNGRCYSPHSINCDGIWYSSSFDWMEEEELKYLFHVANDNYERLAAKEELEYKTKKRQEAIEFYTKSASEDTQEGV